MRQHSQQMDRVNVPRVLAENLYIQCFGTGELPGPVLFERDFNGFFEGDGTVLHDSDTDTPRRRNCK